MAYFPSVEGMQSFIETEICRVYLARVQYIHRCTQPKYQANHHYSYPFESVAQYEIVDYLQSVFQWCGQFHQFVFPFFHDPRAQPDLTS